MPRVTATRSGTTDESFESGRLTRADRRDALLDADVGAAATVEGMFRALIRGALQAAAERGHVFSALRSAGVRSRDLRREQRGRDVETIRAFAGRAMRELGL